MQQMKVSNMINEFNINLIDEDVLNVELQDEQALEIQLQNDIIEVEARDYDRLANKPQINYVELKGNKTLDDLDIQKKGDYPDDRVTNLEIDSLF